MGVRYSQEKFAGYPVPEDGVSFSKLSASGISAYVALSNIVFSGNYTFDTISITLKGITVPPYNKPGKSGYGGVFSFRNRNWTVIDVVEGPKFNIAGTDKFISWTVTGVDLTAGRISIG
ncbi:hypothetical protein [Chroococcidiopsis sp.]|uniref:hypothetical protein n=1 Tax=Chroococcidiopsis sp. TaxID=3088168 RepID=UPI003F2CFE59